MSSERLAAAVTASVNSVSNSFDTPLAETINGLYETGADQSRNPWRIVDEVELAAAEWVSWFNTAGFTSTADIPPIELEAAEYAHHQNQPRAETPHLLVCTVQPEVWLGGRSDRAARGGISQVPSMADHTEHRRETRPGHR